MIRYALVTVPLLAVSPAFAASSQWQESEGGAVRLVTTGLPDKDGNLRGVLEIDLKPGWKTYWRNPGAAGIPPQIDISRSPHIGTAEIGYPAPERIHDGETQWAGYKHSVSLPITFTLDRANAVTLIDADVFLGICETICIPFQASFMFDPGAGAEDVGDALAVERAFASLPAPADAHFGITGIERSGDALILKASLPPSAQNPALFIDHERAHLLGTPRLESPGEDSANFIVEISPGEVEELENTLLIYTLTVDGTAVAGDIEIP
ncbi:protein-disulfide reductase DsbD domain-containing protein [uncultured Nitratireductor sp.]|uniref:protein-disulfide reductase DsbD domain-containing protein n=1 Tax=uncultured Nitratireductor sp. TaxID=520953 RepID=UPI0025DE4F81|nr:protein-disulfide reductase DsbD domain-containing protein [uncultured Nitratireductor sp.]